MEGPGSIDGASDQDEQSATLQAQSIPIGTSHISRYEAAKQEQGVTAARVDFNCPNDHEYMEDTMHPFRLIWGF